MLAAAVRGRPVPLAALDRLTAAALATRREYGGPATTSAPSSPVRRLRELGYEVTLISVPNPSQPGFS